MSYKYLTCFIIISATFFSCIQKKYFVNPGYGNAMQYHTLPLHSDSIKSSAYLNASVMQGTGNYQNSDEQYGLNVNVYNANSFSNFKIWYGAGLTLGIYDINSDNDYYNDSTAVFININGGNKFYGSVNGNAGITYALQLGNAEWRVLGIQATAQ